MASISCSKTGCLYTTSDQVDNDTHLTDKLVLLRIHGSDVQAWDQFIARLTLFKSTVNISVTSASMGLLNCLDQELGHAVLEANSGTTAQGMTEQDLTQTIKHESKISAQD